MVRHVFVVGCQLSAHVLLSQALPPPLLLHLFLVIWAVISITLSLFHCLIRASLSFPASILAAPLRSCSLL